MCKKKRPAQGRPPYEQQVYYFATLGVAEFYYRLAAAAGDGALIRRGDGFMATVRAYAPASGDLAEQFDRTTGLPASARNLAWSHAAFVTAAAARKRAHRKFGQLS